MARLPRCPLCGAKCFHDKTTTWDGKVLATADIVCAGKDCLYTVASDRLHLALAAKVKPPKVLAKGYACDVSRRYQRLCGGPLPGGCGKGLQKASNCRRVLIVEEKP